jgi:hypothetical protein
MRHPWIVALIVAACGPAPRPGVDDDDGAGDDDGGGGGHDGGTETMVDAPASTADAAPDATPPGIISGGPCLSGANGATAYRVKWIAAGSQAQVVYEVNGLPDTTRDHTGAFGLQIGYVPQFVDPFLGDGGLQLDGGNFVDIELSTAGIAQIGVATLAIFGRSFNTTTSGSFTWQTFDGTGSAPMNSVSNVAPYAWYSAEMTTELSPGDAGVLLRIKAGPASGSLVVHRIELCMQAT